MRITYRKSDVYNYWNKRWSDICVDAAMSNEEVYPLNYALKTIGDYKGTILEAGCGVGRLLRYFKERKHDIVGIDFIDIAISKLKQADNGLNVEVGDITNLRFRDKSFSFVLAFGLYHSLEKNLEVAVRETYRVLEGGGKVCASFRADNITTRISDWVGSVERNQSSKEGKLSFHKRNLTRKEFIQLFEAQGFVVESVIPVENMPVLYKFRLFRNKTHKEFDEKKPGRRVTVCQKLEQFFRISLCEYHQTSFVIYM